MGILLNSNRNRRLGTITVLLCLSLLLSSTPTSARGPSDSSGDLNLHGTVSGFGSLTSDMPGYSNNGAGWGWNIRIGGRRSSYLSDHRFTPGFFIETSRDRWVMAETHLEMAQGTWNTGVGLEILLLQKQIRVAISTGVSVLLSDTVFHRTGDTGNYVDIHPLSLRRAIGRRKLIFEVSPLTCTWLSLGRGQFRIRRLEYRTVVSLEVPF